MKRTADREVATPHIATTITYNAPGQCSMLDAVRRWTWHNLTGTVRSLSET
jgi:hypothetical protein